MREMLRDGFGAGARATSGRLSTPGWVTWSLISFGITAVSVPTLAVLYDVFVPIAFVLGILQGGSVLLAALRPWWGAAAQLAAVAGFVAAANATGGPWPMPVLGMIALGGVLVAVGLGGCWGVGAVNWVAARGRPVCWAIVTPAFRPPAADGRR